MASSTRQARSETQEARSKKREARSKKREARSKKQEVRSKKREVSLLPGGIVDEAGVEFARGVVNYSSQQVALLIGRASYYIPDVLGYNGPEELVGRQNLALLEG